MGEVVGLVDGELVGVNEGEREGATVGARVLFVGEEDGDNVAKKTSAQQRTRNKRRRKVAKKN